MKGLGIWYWVMGISELLTAGYFLLAIVSLFHASLRRATFGLPST